VERLLTVDQVAERLALRPATVRSMIRTGRLQVVRPTGARAIRVPESDVEALVRRGQRGIDGSFAAPVAFKL